MSPRSRPPRLFEHTGFTIRSMVVDRETLGVRPLVPELFQTFTGTRAARVERSDVVWTNALGAQVIALSPARPVRALSTAIRKINTEVRVINEALAPQGAMLVPCAAHPFMDPAQETVLWPLDGSEVYAAYDRVVGVRQHGWSNSIGQTLELPFATDDEFTKLHAAVRMVLPLIPALCAASPVLDGAVTGLHCSRLDAWSRRAERLAVLSGPLIPEAVFSQEDYYREIYAPTGQALARADKQRVLDHLAANARLAAPRFDDGVLVIRAIDAQESVSAGLALAELILAVIKTMAQGRWVSSYLQRAWGGSELNAVLQRTMKDGMRAVINDKDYLLMFGVMRAEKMTARELWAHLIESVRAQLGEHVLLHAYMILKDGDLAARILKRTGRKPSRGKLVQVYRELGACLAEDRTFN